MTTTVRKAFFRALAILLGLSPFVLLELGLAVMDWGNPQDFADPFVGFRSIRPLFVYRAETDRWEIPAARQAWFRPESFSGKKRPNEFRIFVLGGSTVQGRPYAIETSFTTWLELSLNASDPSRFWEVVNCGGISYASYRLIPILEEVLGHQADLIIVYSGHNEFLEDRTYSDLKQSPWWIEKVQQAAGKSRIFTLAADGYRRLVETEEVKPANILPTEVEAVLDYQGGLQQYHRDPEWQFSVIEHYEWNLRRMVAICKVAGVPLIFANPVSNLRDTPPFKTEPSAGLTDAQREQWKQAWERARDCYASDLLEAVERLREAIDIDPLHAGVYFDLGKCLEQLGDFDGAKQAYLKAKDLDVCPLRMLEPMHEKLWSVVQSTQTPIVDVRKLIESRSTGGIPGNDWLVDHVHPTIPGHQLVAEAMLEKMVELGFLQPSDGWERSRDQRYEEHLASLDHLYYLRGEKRLLGLKAWAEGRVRDRRKEAVAGGSK